MIVPELGVRGGPAALEFYAAAFGARVEFRVGDESVVAQLAVGEARFWVHDESPSHGIASPRTVGGATTRLLLVVDDADAVVAQAVAAGATLHAPVGDAHGWRLGRIEDPFGHHWEIARPLGPWPGVSLPAGSR